MLLGWWPVGFYCQPQSHSLSSGLWTLNLELRFWTWTLDLDFGLGFGTRLGLDNCVYSIVLIILFCWRDNKRCLIKLCCLFQLFDVISLQLFRLWHTLVIETLRGWRSFDKFESTSSVKLRSSSQFFQNHQENNENSSSSSLPFPNQMIDEIDPAANVWQELIQWQSWQGLICSLKTVTAVMVIRWSINLSKYPSM